jgi:hypothetical protein
MNTYAKTRGGGAIFRAKIHSREAALFSLQHRLDLQLIDHLFELLVGLVALHFRIADRFPPRLL